MNESNRPSPGQEAAEELRLPAHTGWGTRLLDGLSSGKLALALIALLILFSLAGAMLPQEGQMPATDIALWQGRHPVVSDLFAPLGLFHAFHCRPFLATILLLAVNTATCTALSLQRHGVFRGLAGLAAVKRAGFITLHLSLLLLFAGGFLSAAARMDAKIILTEGQQFTDLHDQYVQIQEGPLRREGHTGLAFRLQDVDIKYVRQRHRVAVTSRLDVLADGKQVAAGVVQVNKPFAYQGLSFTQDETGFSPRLTIRNAARGRVLADSFVALQTVKTAKGREYRDFLPLPFLKQRIVVTLYPSFTREDGQVLKAGDAPDNPMLLMEVEDEAGVVVQRHYLQLGEGVTIGPNRFVFAELRQWASFRVGDDPGYPLVCAALWLGLIALLLRYVPDLRNWFGELTLPSPVLDVLPGSSRVSPPASDGAGNPARSFHRDLLTSISRPR